MLTEFVDNDLKIPRTGGVMPSHNEESLQIIGSSKASSILLTCEHASNDLPSPHNWRAEQADLQQTHWAWDPGSKDITRALAKAIDAPALLGKWSRLWIDLNRPVGSPTMFRKLADNHPVALNRDLCQADADARIAYAYTPYYTTLQRLVESIQPNLGFSIHTFTPCYEGTTREVEIGVLYDHDESAAHVLIDAFTRAGFLTRANEPWSGKQGMMFAISNATSQHDTEALEIEVRQDIATDPHARERVVAVLAQTLPLIANHHASRSQ